MCVRVERKKNKNNMNSRPQSERLESWAGKGEIITEDATCRVFVSA